MTLNIFFTVLRKKTPNECVSWYTVYGLYISIIIMVAQIFSIHYNVRLLSDIPFTID